MTTTFNFKAKKDGQPLYKQLARYFRDEIQEDHLQGGDMLPSIRKLTKDLKVSRTTVEAAYEILIDQGYVQNLPSRGFRITLTKPAVPVEMPPLQEESFHRPSFNFANHYIDTTTFDTVLWRRAISRVLHSPDTLSGYGDPQGEPRLREVLARYSYQSRGVVCRPEQILVGAGLQSLLSILIPLLPVEEKRVSFEAPGFPQAEWMFHLMGWTTDRYDPAVPSKSWPELLVVSPTNPYKGRALSEKERSNLIVATQFERVYLLEDDYNWEFRYLHHPVPALHSFGNRERIIYVGSFSRTMLPSLRISYLVLPESFLPRFQKEPDSPRRCPEKACPALSMPGPGAPDSGGAAFPHSRRRRPRREEPKGLRTPHHPEYAPADRSRRRPHRCSAHCGDCPHRNQSRQVSCILQHSLG